MVEIERWLSARQAASVIGVGEIHVTRLRDAGKIEAKKTAIGWLYDPESVEDFAERRASGKRLGRGFVACS